MRCSALSTRSCSGDSVRSRANSPPNRCDVVKVNDAQPAGGVGQVAGSSRSRSQTGVRVPRVDHLDARVPEVRTVPGGQRRAPDQTDGGDLDLRIEAVDRDPRTLPSGDDIGVPAGRRRVERQDLLGEAAEDLVGRSAQRVSAMFRPAVGRCLSAFSAAVTALVTTTAAVCRCSQARTSGAGDARISSGTTFVSRTIKP